MADNKTSHTDEGLQDNEQIEQAILALQHAMDHYDPSLIGYEWDDTSPRIQMEPRGERGYIELRAVKRKIKK